jgi:hypothetical protein
MLIDKIKGIEDVVVTSVKAGKYLAKNGVPILSFLEGKYCFKKSKILESAMKTMPKNLVAEIKEVNAIEE